MNEYIVIPNEFSGEYMIIEHNNTDGLKLILLDYNLANDIVNELNNAYKKGFRKGFENGVIEKGMYFNGI